MKTLISQAIGYPISRSAALCLNCWFKHCTTNIDDYYHAHELATAKIDYLTFYRMKVTEAIVLKLDDFKLLYNVYVSAHLITWAYCLSFIFEIRIINENIGD